MNIPPKSSEQVILIEIAKKLLIPLFGTVIFEKSYQDYVHDLEGAEAEHIGLGSMNTWHTSADLKIESCYLVQTFPNDAKEEVDPQNEDEESPDVVLSPMLSHLGNCI